MINSSLTWKCGLPKYSGLYVIYTTTDEIYFANYSSNTQEFYSNKLDKYVFPTEYISAYANAYMLRNKLKVLIGKKND